MDEATRDRISKLVSDNDVLLFMKGTPSAPQCGFSARVVSMLEELGCAYASENVLADEQIRQGIKEFSDWPTIPQLYVRGEFIGGCDIVSEMFEAGELEEKLGVKLEAVPAPKVTLTEPAARALREALQSSDELVRVQVDPRFNHALSIGPREAKDVAVEVSGVTLLFDRGSARRADGIVIDFVDSPDGPAFKIDNPNEPPRVRPITPRELKARLDAGEAVELYDVRTEQEREIARIEGARLLDKEAQKHIMGLEKDAVLVLHCHHGSRSQQAAEFFVAHGFRNVYNLVGGIDAWSRDVDPSVPRY